MSIVLREVSHTYMKKTPLEHKALDGVDLEIQEGEMVAIIGHTGSGKSTLIQHMKGLLQPDSGMVVVDGIDINNRTQAAREMKAAVGLVFQYPEHQLFEVDVLTDVCFGPKNLGFSKKEAESKAREALYQVGVSEELFTKSPFELSGGQKRRVAIAGVLAMDPQVLILDEPTAGLDPKGRDEILEQIKYLHEERGITILLVSHSMEDVARYADRLIVINDAHIAFDDTPREVFKHYKELETMGLAAPQVTYIMHALKEKGLKVDANATTVAEAKASILKALRKA